MKVLMICGVFAKENQQQIIDHARDAVDFSANQFQQKIISGFRQLDYDFSVLSAPFIGTFPTSSSIVNFTGFSQPQSEYTYVTFNNIWGIRSVSRAIALKKAVRPFAESDDDDKLILVYAAHTPFLEAAVYAKKLDPRIRICLYVPDLPTYMNLNANRGWLYDLAKKYDVAAINRLMQEVDSFILLTEQMKDALPIGNRPYRVAEGIIAQLPESIPEAAPASAGEEKYVVYTGKLNEQFGVKHLIDSFSYLEDPTCRLILCGRGDCEGYAAQMHEKDPRILPQGQLTPEEAISWQRRAAVLINPRNNEGEFTKYSFPSKIIEYILTGKPVAAYMLDGMPACYRDYLYELDPALPPAEAICKAIQDILQSGADSAREKAASFLAHAGQALQADKIAQTIVEISSKG